MSVWRIYIHLIYPAFVLRFDIEVCQMNSSDESSHVTGALKPQANKLIFFKKKHKRMAAILKPLPCMLESRV